MNSTLRKSSSSYLEIRTVYNEKQLHVLLDIHDEEQCRAYEEITETGRYAVDYGTTLDFYKYSESICRDGDDGEYLSTTAKEIMNRLVSSQSIFNGDPTSCVSRSCDVRILEWVSCDINA